MNEEKESMTCQDCKFYQPYRNPETERIKPSQKGECLWRPEWPEKWAISYRDNWTWELPKPPLPRELWGETNAADCQTFEAKEEKKP